MEACPFSLEYTHQVLGTRRMAVLTADGEFNQQFIRSFALSMKEETGVNPALVFGERPCLTPGDIIRAYPLLADTTGYSFPGLNTPQPELQ